MKTTWKIIKESTGNVQPINTIREINTGCRKITDKQEIANHFNKIFVNVASDAHKHIDMYKVLQLLKVRDTNKLEDMKVVPVTEAEVINVIGSMQGKSSTGFDGISSKILKTCASIISKPLAFVFNSSLVLGTFPERCKYAIVRPIYKGGEKSKVNNYRPISLLISFSKILETLMFNRLNQHLQVNGILIPEQFGYRKGISIEKPIFNLVDNILISLDQQLQIGGIFCDLTKAFDCVYHEILLKKLSYYGICDTYLSWLKSYLTNRKQKVTLCSSNQGKELSSSWETIRKGVPQGSVLGPLLFLVYINDLPYGFNKDVRFVLYADDTSVLVTANDKIELQSKLNFTLNKICSWFAVNGLSLNKEKTKVVKFSANHAQEHAIAITCQNASMDLMEDVTFLGLRIDRNINWKKHIEEILPKLSSACYVVRSMYYIGCIATLKMIYYAYFHSKLQYGIIFWGNSVESTRVFQLQKKIIRAMTGSNTRVSCRPLFKSLGIMTLPSQYILTLMRFLSQNIEMYVTNGSVHELNTRNKLKLYVPNVNLSLRQKGVHYASIKIFNKLPKSIADLVLVKGHFIASLEKYLLKKTFYSVDEFLND